MEGAAPGYAVSMCRPFALAVLWCAFFVPSAAAATVGVYDGPDLGAVALAGPDAVVLKHDFERDRGSLVVVPRGGGTAKTVLRVDGMRDLYEVEPRKLAASALRVALIAEIINSSGNTLEWRVYSGPPRGPITLVRSLPPDEQWVPASVDVDGDRMLLVESRPESDGPIRAFVLDGASGLVPIPWARASAMPLELSGAFVAADMAGPNRVGVLDLATGAELVKVPLADRERGLDLSLAPDGRVAVRTRAGVRVGGPGAEPRLLPGTKGLSQVHLAGTTLAAIDAKGRAVALGVGGGGAPRALGPPTRVPEAGAGDATGYAFIANGCARVASIPLTSAPVRKSDPCPRTEISLYYIASTTLRGNMIDAPIRCVTAPRGVCRGTAIARIYEGDGKAAATGRFAVPAGKERNVKLRVTPAALKRFKREGYGNLVLDARIPNGRVGVGDDGNSELGVKIPVRD